MLNIKLADLNFYIINLQKDVDKKKFIEDQMIKLGFNYTFIRAIKVNPRPIGIALSHLKVLKLDGLKRPFVILEDDCQFFEERVHESIELPDETDALYLGHSHFGVRKKDQYGLQWGKQFTAKYSIYNSKLIRIHSMLARHGIVYLSEKFHKNAIEANLKALLHYDFPHPGDMAYQEIQEDHLLLSTHQPICYQSEKHRGNHPATKKSLVDSLKPIDS